MVIGGALVLALGGGVSTVRAEPPQGYHLVWSEEFGGSALDSNKWRFWNKPQNNPNNEQQAFTVNRPQNASVANGLLSITAVQEDYHYDYVFQGTRYHDSRPFTSAQVVSKQAFEYGYFEFRAKMPAGTGFFPAIWLWPEQGEAVSVPWPQDGEIDIMENYGKNMHEIFSTAHYGNDSAAKAGIAGHNYYDPHVDFSQFHTYALQWTPTELDWYLDGKKYMTVAAPYYDVDASGNKTPIASPFDKPFCILLDLAMTEPGSGTAFPQAMQVDYARVYQTAPEPGSLGLLAVGAGALLGRRRRGLAR